MTSSTADATFFDAQATAQKTTANAYASALAAWASSVGTPYATEQADAKQADDDVANADIADATAQGTYINAAASAVTTDQTANVTAEANGWFGGIWDQMTRLWNADPANNTQERLPDGSYTTPGDTLSDNERPWASIVHRVVKPGLNVAKAPFEAAAMAAEAAMEPGKALEALASAPRRAVEGFQNMSTQERMDIGMEALLGFGAGSVLARFFGGAGAAAEAGAADAEVVEGAVSTAGRQRAAAAMEAMDAGAPTVATGEEVAAAMEAADSKLIATEQMPKTLKEVDLAGRIRAAGGKSLKEAGEFFGWEPSMVTKTAADFTREQLLARGWTKERLLNVAEAYETIALITPANPSAAGRAAQLREIAKLLD